MDCADNQTVPRYNPSHCPNPGRRPESFHVLFLFVFVSTYFISFIISGFARHHKKPVVKKPVVKKPVVKKPVVKKPVVKKPVVKKPVVKKPLVLGLQNRQNSL